jgi:hypothetical protein
MPRRAAPSGGTLGIAVGLPWAWFVRLRPANIQGGVLVSEPADREHVCASCERPFRFDDSAVIVDTHLVHLLCSAQVRPRPSAGPLRFPRPEPIADRRAFDDD